MVNKIFIPSSQPCPSPRQLHRTPCRFLDIPCTLLPLCLYTCYFCYLPSLSFWTSSLFFAFFCEVFTDYQKRLLIFFPNLLAFLAFYLWSGIYYRLNFTTGAEHLFTFPVDWACFCYVLRIQKWLIHLCTAHCMRPMTRHMAGSHQSWWTTGDGE